MTALRVERFVRGPVFIACMFGMGINDWRRAAMDFMYFALEVPLRPLWAPPLRVRLRRVILFLRGKINHNMVESRGTPNARF